MNRIHCLAGLTTLSALIASSPALAGGCPGVFVRDSPSYDNRNDTGALERVEVVVPKGTRDTIIGYTVVGGKTFYVQYRSAPQAIDWLWFGGVKLPRLFALRWREAGSYQARSARRYRRRAGCTTRDQRMKPCRTRRPRVA